MSLLKQKNLIALMRENIKDFDGEIMFLKGRVCGGKSRCSGIFFTDSEDRPIIKVATNNFKNREDWLGTLVHEYCHFEQWKNNNSVWHKYDSSNISLEQVLLKPGNFKKELVDIIALELDCEKKSVRIIKNNNLFDTTKYIIYANAVLFKYVHAYHFGSWPEKSIKSIEVTDICPNKLLKSAGDYLKFDKSLIKKAFLKK